MSKRVVLGMSGGVDSSVAAHVLREDGYEVIGVTLKLLPDDIIDSCPTSKIIKICCSAEAIDEARVTALRIGIPHYVVDGKELFSKKIMDTFINEYVNGKTPNPCANCNPNIKIPLLDEVAKEVGADFVATGHYVKRVERDGIVELVRGDEKIKEQTYMLSLLSPEQVSKLLLPMGNHSKAETRKIAEEIDIPTANKPDSQDICFVPDNDYRGFLHKNAEDKILKGNIIDENGKILGTHNGHINYTVGQRKGLGIQHEFPLYVLEVDSKGNVIVGYDKKLYKSSMIVKSVVFQHPEFTLPGKYLVQVRYHHDPVLATVEKIDDEFIKIDFDEPVRAITPGQVAAFYRDNVLMGGGIIHR